MMFSTTVFQKIDIMDCLKDLRATLWKWSNNEPMTVILHQEHERTSTFRTFTATVDL